MENTEEKTIYEKLTDCDWSWGANRGTIMELNANGVEFANFDEITCCQIGKEIPKKEKKRVIRIEKQEHRPRRTTFDIVMKNAKGSCDTFASLVKIGELGRYGIVPNPTVNIDGTTISINVQLRNPYESFYEVPVPKYIIDNTLENIFNLGANREKSIIDKNKVKIWIPSTTTLDNRVIISALCAGIAKYGKILNDHYFDGGSISLKFEI